MVSREKGEKLLKIVKIKKKLLQRKAETSGGSVESNTFLKARDLSVCSYVDEVKPKTGEKSVIQKNK